MAETTGPVGQPQQKQGMSRGCLVSLIVVGVIAVLVIAAAVVCYVYREDLVKTASVTTLNGIKSEIAQNPPGGVDTARFNGVTDSFIAKLNADTAAMDMVQFQALMQTIGTVMDDRVVDSSEVEMLETALFRYYPEIGDEYDLSPAYDSDMSDSLIDTTAN